MDHLDAVRAAVESSVSAGHFFVTHPHRLRIESRRDEEVAWETFRGHLLESSHCAHSRRCDSWHVFVDDEHSLAPVPLLSVHWDDDAQEIVILRRILTHGFEAYEDAPGVILSRPAQKWVRELVATFDDAATSEQEVIAEISTCVFLAVIGTSRLPITSLESPLPAFSLGQLAYFPNLDRDDGAWWIDPLDVLRAALDGGMAGVELVKALEIALRATADARQPRIAQVLDTYAKSTEKGAQRVDELIRGLFRYVALSPYGNYVDRFVGMLAALAEAEALGPAAIVNVVGSMLTQLGRHLTAFDLAAFHNSGANYPDALFLDALLKLYLRLVERQPELFLEGQGDLEEAQRAKRIRRRALRQACLFRQHYEGLRVPDAPTSQGESQRVLPDPFVRVPEEQIANSLKRRRILFADEPFDQLLASTARRALQASLDELSLSVELRELGQAYYLDRPLGVAKRPGEVDRTPLVSHTAWSRSIVKRRLDELREAGWITGSQHAQLQQAADALLVVGVPVAELNCIERLGVVSLADACQAAADFVVLRSGMEEVLGAYDWSALGPLAVELLACSGPTRAAVLVHHAVPAGAGSQPTLRLYDARRRLRVELGFDYRPDNSVTTIERGGVELVERLRVLRTWETRGDAAQFVPRSPAAAGQWITLRASGAGPST